MPCAVELAEQVGTDKPKKEVVDAYDASYGKYEGHDHPQVKSAPLPAEPKPFTVSGGK